MRPHFKNWQITRGSWRPKKAELCEDRSFQYWRSDWDGCTRIKISI